MTVWRLIALSILIGTVKSELDGLNFFQDDTTRVEALGRDVELGGFYDLRNDRMSPPFMKFIQGEIPAWAVKIEPHPFNASHSTIIRKASDIMKNFEANNEMRINFVLGILPIDADRATYLTWAKQKPVDSRVRGDVLFRFGTIVEKLDIYEANLEPSMATSHRSRSGQGQGQSQGHSAASSRSPFTHVITSIQYGATVSVQFEQRFPDEGFSDSFGVEGEVIGHRSFSRGDLERHMNRQMEMLQDPIDGRELYQNYLRDFPDAPKFNIEITGDIPYDRNGNIEDLFQVFDFLQRIPENLALIEDGRGYPISFEVTSIKDILANIGLSKINDFESGDLASGNPPHELH